MPKNQNKVTPFVTEMTYGIPMTDVLSMLGIRVPAGFSLTGAWVNHDRNTPSQLRIRLASGTEADEQPF